MFEKVSQMAEQMATNVSRRQLLGRLGGAALAAAAAVGGILAIPTVARAGKRLPCGNLSTFTCVDHYTGDACYESGRHGSCAYRDKSSTSCYCRVKGGGGGRDR